MAAESRLREGEDEKEERKSLGRGSNSERMSTAERADLSADPKSKMSSLHADAMDRPPLRRHAKAEPFGGD